jgi:hypothetical protein
VSTRRGDLGKTLTTLLCKPCSRVRHTARALQIAIVALSVLSCEDGDAPDPRFRETSRSGAPPGRFLYTASQSNRVSGFSIDRITGALTEIAGSPFTINGYQPEGYPYQGLHVDKAGKFLYVAGSRGGNPPEFSLVGYAIDRITGAITQIPGTPITSTSSFRHARFHPTGHALYLPAGAEGIRAYSIDPASGGLTPVAGQPYRLADDWLPWPVAFDPSGSTAFVASNANTTASFPSRVNAFAVDATTGALTLQGTVDYTGSAGGIVVHPGGRYAYMWAYGPVAVIGVENPAAMTIASAASAPPVGGASGYLGIDAVIEDAGRHAYFGYNVQILIGGRPGHLAAYQIDTVNGALMPSPGSPYVVVGGGG